MTEGNTAPAGWFADPLGARVLRYWDGARWTDHLVGMPGEAIPQAALEAERVAARRMRLALLAYPPVLTIVTAAALVNLDDFDFDASRSGFGGFSTENLGLQALGLLSVPFTIFFVLWIYRAATTAHSLGFRAPRSPALAAVSWFIPVVNFWWPYQSVRAMAPDARELQPNLG